MKRWSGTLTLIGLTAVLCFPGISGLAQAPANAPLPGDQVFADFESGSYDGWTTQGDCWGKAPATDDLFAGQITGFQGQGFACTLSPRRGSVATGRATSRDFTIDKPFIRFLIGGGNFPGQACLNLVVDGKTVASATGDGMTNLTRKEWDVTALRGKTAHLEIVDSTEDAHRGYVCVDDIVFAAPTMGAPAHLDVDVPQFAAVSPIIQNFLLTSGVPGAACAIIRNGKLCYAHGFGYASPDHMERFTSRTLCRIGSVSKPITATAVLKLVEMGKLSLDAKAYDLLHIEPAVGKALDPRIRDITVRDLLQHRSGYGDAEWWATSDIAKELHVPMPVTRNDVIKVALSRPLESAPGTRYVYNNLNYYMLARIIEQVTGDKYEHWVQENVFKPIGITDMFCIRARLSERRAGEAVYVDLPNRKAPSAFPEDGGKLVPLSYGGINYQETDGGGGWVGSVRDLARFFASLTGTNATPILSMKSMAEMAARPTEETRDSYYGLGVEFTDDGRHNGSLLYLHNGAVSGAYCIVQNRFDGSTFIVLMNADNEKGDVGAPLVQPLQDAINAVINGGRWPETDLFSAN